MKITPRTIASVLLRKLWTVSSIVFGWLTFLMDSFLSGRNVPAPIFIIGAPRTGSTILYQALTNSLDVLYIDNIAAKFYSNIFIGFLISKAIYKDKPHNSFDSKFGNTAEFGGHAPSECGEFWYQWLPKQDHFVDHGTVSDKSREELKFSINFPSKWFAKHILFKNLNAGQRLRLINEAFPDAKIIYIQRDLKDTVSSILKARHSIGVSKDKIWSIRPKDYRSLEGLPEEEMCLRQVLLLQEQIELDLALFCQKNVFYVNYSELSEELIEELRSWIGVSARAGYVRPKFQSGPPRERR